MIGALGHRARASVAHAFGAARIAVSDEQARLVETSMETFIAYGEALAPHLGDLADARGEGLLGSELARRIDASIEAVLDLASVVRDRSLITRARAALQRAGRDRQNALALLETILPSSLGRRLIALVDATDGASERPGAEGERVPLDGWLLRCRLFDRGELPSSDPMRSVLDRVLVLRNVELFRALSAEELYPVAEIARAESFEPGDEIVRQGEPSDDLFVIVEGTCEARKDGEVVSELPPGKAFGELGVLDGSPRAATVVAKTPATLLSIARQEFEALLDESPELAKGVIKALLVYARRA
jgi:hypothetical protein